LTALASWLGLSIVTHSTMPSSTSCGSIFGSFFSSAIVVMLQIVLAITSP
jgi:hypothetical protein